MRSARQLPLVALVAVALSAGARAQGQGTDYSKIDITAEKVAPNLYMLSGSAGLDPGHQDAAGGRIGVLAGAVVLLGGGWLISSRRRKTATADDRE